MMLATNQNLKAQVSKELRAKANDFLNSRRHANNIVDIIAHLEQSGRENLSISAAVLTLEVIFTELLKRREMSIDVVPLKGSEDDTPETQYRKWLQERYDETLKLIVDNIDHEKTSEAIQALVTSMKLLAAESKYPLDKTESSGVFLKERLRNVLQKVVSYKKSQAAVIQRFKEYTEYLDVVCCSWKLLPYLVSRTAFAQETLACNYLELINTLSVSKDLQEEKKYFCKSVDGTSAIGHNGGALRFDYSATRKCINKVWNCLLQWTDGLQPSVHKLLLVVLLERILPHLDKPILLTDFLMDSLDCGGPVSLLALQGVFTLIQKHNITYPKIYEKLYSMFEPEIFHTKYKARLFYLADIFLTSTHLPESLVAAFAKRLARLSLIAPPQDIVIILYFVGNLILRHPGLKRLICSQSAVEVSRDPYIMEEREPTKSNALESSLWEIASLQKHAIPSVVTAARFISQSLPTTEWNLSSVLEVKEDDIFDQEIAKKTKQYALAFERPQSLFLANNDKVIQYWNLF